MDIFTKISLFSSIGIISSGIFLPESKALYEKIEEVEKKVKTRSRNFTPVNGEISIGGLNYEISSQMDGNERITTITPFLGETQLSISKEFRKDKKDFGTKTPGIDQKLNQLIINSNKVIAKDNTFSPDARAAAIGRLDAFYVSPNLPEEEKDVIQSFIECTYIELKDKLASNNGDIEEQKGAMKQLAALCVSPATSSETKDEIKKYVIDQTRNFIIDGSIVRFLMDEEMGDKLKRVAPEGKVFAVILQDPKSRMEPPDFAPKETKDGIACFYQAKDKDLQNKLELLPEFFNGRPEGDIDIDQYRGKIEKELRTIDQAISSKNELEQEEYDKFNKQLESYKSEIQKIIGQVNPLYDKSLIMNAFSAEAYLQIFSEGERGCGSTVLGYMSSYKKGYEKLLTKIEAALEQLKEKK